MTKLFLCCVYNHISWLDNFLLFTHALMHSNTHTHSEYVSFCSQVENWGFVALLLTILPAGLFNPPIGNHCYLVLIPETSSPRNTFILFWSPEHSSLPRNTSILFWSPNLRRYSHSKKGVKQEQDSNSQPSD